MSSPGIALRLSEVEVVYPGAKALAGVDLVVRAGERVALIGPSGAGKSTLLGLCNGTVAPTRGRVEVLGDDLAMADRARARAIGARVGTVYQRLHLVGQLRVIHNVNAGRPAGLGGRQRLQRFRTAYERRRNAGGRLPASYQVWYLQLEKAAAEDRHG